MSKVKSQVTNNVGKLLHKTCDTYYLLAVNNPQTSKHCLNQRNTLLLRHPSRF